MARLTVNLHDASARAMKQRLVSALAPGKQANVIRKAAYVWQGRMVRRTPKRWTGQTRRHWKVTRIGENTFRLENDSQVMKWLEAGTKPHGPKKAKLLFVPLTRKAAAAGARGVISANNAAKAQAAWSNYGSAVTGAKAKKAKLPFIPGKDFVFAKRVKGIRPMWIVRSARVDARITLRLLMRLLIREAITA